MARPRKVSPETVAETVDKIIQEYKTSGNVDVLSDYELMQRLGISPRTLERYYDGEADKALLDDSNISDTEKEKYQNYGYGQAVKKLIGFRSATCISHLSADLVNSGWIFLSKQPHWGGFQDVQRVEKQSSGSFTVCIAGPDGKPLKE